MSSATTSRTTKMNRSIMHRTVITRKLSPAVRVELTVPRDRNGNYEPQVINPQMYCCASKSSVT